MRARCLYFLLAFLLMTSSPLGAAMRPVLKKRMGIPPTEILKEIIRTKPLPAEKAVKTIPVVTWLTEPDERLSAAMFMRDSLNRVYTVSCPGAQLLPAAASVDFGIHELLTPVLLIAYSSESRFIKLFLDGYASQDEAMQRILDHLHLALDSGTAAAGKAKVNPPTALLTAIEKDIDYQVRAAMDRYGDRIAEGRLLVAGGVIDLDNAYGHGKNQLVLININGETNPQKMRLMREVATIGAESARLLGRDKPAAALPSKGQQDQAKVPPKPSADK